MLIPLNHFVFIFILRGKYIFLHIGVEKAPILKKGLIKSYKLTEYLHSLDMIGDSRL
jgi:hypothetical protein